MTSRSFVFVCVFGFGVTWAVWAAAQPESDSRRQEASASDADKASAKESFEQGLALSKQGAWEAALAAFLRSRELYATRGNTQNAAVALSRLGRYDEAHDMFDQLLRDFPNLGDSDRALVEDELKRLRGLVGHVEVVSAATGATVLIDGVRRGTIPLGPVRVNAGTRLVRVFRPGYTPFTARVDVAGAETKTVDVTLQKLARSGTLRVNETGGKQADVYVDGVRVGTTPWTGELAPGHHWVVLQGAGALGSPPTPAPVRADDTTVLNLSLVALDCRLLVQPEPASAAVAIDGVTVGRGRFEGRLPCGARRVEVADEGFLATHRTITLDAKSPHTLTVTLERDPNSKMWAGATGVGLFVGIDVGPILSTGLGGQAEAGCGDRCSAAPLLGMTVQARVGYRFLSGFGAGLSLGVVRSGSSVEGASIRVRDDSTSGRPLEDATSNVDSAFYGVMGAVEASYRQGDQWPWLARLGLGVFVGEVDQRRAGSLSETESFSAVRAQIPARYALAAPELRIGPKLGDSLHLTFGVRALFMVALEQPKFPEATRSQTSTRLISFDEGAVAGRFVWAITPTLGVDYTL